jgi:hypothetical protein
VTKEGTWLAGKDAPAAMIMAAHPTVGDVFRTENSPGFAFEEVTVTATGRTLDGPLGPLPDGLLVRELHMDGGTEDKSFAAGYGEFLTTDGSDVEALALAVPTASSSAAMPAELEAVRNGAMSVFDAVGSKHWSDAARDAANVRAAWSRLGSNDIPRLVGPRMRASLDALDAAVGDRAIARARMAALRVAESSLDIELRYRDPRQVDLARMDLWADRLLVDVSRDDAASVRGDVFTLTYLRDRILSAVSDAKLSRLNSSIQALQVAAIDEELAAAASLARGLQRALAG